MLFKKNIPVGVSAPARKAIKICLWTTVVLMTIFGIKNSMMHYFISKFKNELPWVHLSQAKIQDFPENYHTVGIFVASKAIEISPSVGGIIEEVLFKPGQIVKKDDPLIQLDAHIEHAQLLQQRAEYKLQLRLYQQIKQLYASKNVAETQYLQTKANLKKAHALYNEVFWRWKLKTVRAPFDGIMGISHVFEGQYLSPGQTPVAKLQQTNPIYLDFHVPERFYPYLHLGQKIKLTTSHQEQKIYTTPITTIEPYADTLAHTLLVRAELNASELNVIPGEFANITLKRHPNKKAITIPTQALIASTKGTSVYVAIPQKEPEVWRIHQTPVQVGISKNMQTLIKKGLEGDEWLVDTGTQKISDGRLVKMKSKA